ncbi:hypothetical protein EV191_104163 [Tamaricihabitans halophyticus]|uniref:Uncharacterized protein n=1 Tax=Tamaricihabitans halophyticus TaxID=1262583 RepID=A0A4V2SU83_9PSEU|nr:hypothetical protein [Tamaricihabitans halophyticus]TCP53596.1 hypothetical protein EV191_104163 [Tamaricihabitans halophyticus]
MTTIQDQASEHTEDTPIFAQLHEELGISPSDIAPSKELPAEDHAASDSAADADQEA